MNVVRWVLFAGLLVLAAASVTTYVVAMRPKPAATRPDKRFIYQCPMHPSYTSDKPGECPICGMTLERVELDGGHEGHAAGAAAVPGLAPVRLDPERIQLIGVRTAIAERREMGGRLELVGFVAPDESRLKRIQLRVAGWVQELFVSRTGEAVKAGQPLLSIYSPELVQSEREYLITFGARDTMAGMGHDAELAAASRERLRLMGVPEEELGRLDRELTAATRLTLRSPVTGTVLERGVAEGQYVSADSPLFTLADLSRVWVLGDLYEMDFTRVHAGDVARFTADALPGRAFEGKVELVYPTVSSETRTIKVRMSVDNAGGALRPGMYGKVTVAGGAAQALVVPDEAVVNTGENAYVFVAHAGGLFEPRAVTIGMREGDQVEIVHGLAAGDTVVASASFLIDSESRLKAAIGGMGAQPSTGHVHGSKP